MTAESHAASPVGLAVDGAMTVEEAATFLRVSRSEVYRLMSRGQLAFAKIGKRRVILRRSAVAFLGGSVHRVESDELAGV